jgi:hypothetical protein
VKALLGKWLGRPATGLSVVLGLCFAAPQLAHAADFNLTCNMTSVQNSSNVVYHFILSSNSNTAREASVWRDGSQLTPNRSIDEMPTWTVTTDNVIKASTLWGPMPTKAGR